MDDIQDATFNHENLVEEEANEECKNNGKLNFLHKDKLKVDSSLQVDSWLYNEIIILKKKMGGLQNNLDEKRETKEFSWRIRWVIFMRS